jgi:hypothetical protein
VRENGGDKNEFDAIDNIEAGRIRFSELTLGSLLGYLSSLRPHTLAAQDLIK